MDAHVIYDSVAPLLLDKAPVSLAYVASTLTITLTFNEDVRAGSGSVVLSASGTSDVLVPASSIAFINHIGTIPITGLAAGKTYSVVLAEGLVVDYYGNEFAGIADGEYSLQT